MKKDLRVLVFIALAALAATCSLASTGCRARSPEESVLPGGETGGDSMPGDDLFREALQVMRGDISYRVSGELDLEFQIPSASLAKTGPPYFSAPAGIPYEAFHLSKAGKSASKAVLYTDRMAVDENVPSSLLPLETGNAFFLVDGVYYWEDRSGWHSEPYDPVEAMLRLNQRGLMPEDILNWLIYAESVEVVSEEAGSVGYQVKLGEKYLQGLKAQAQETLSGEALEESLYTLQAVEKLLTSANILVVVEKATKRISEVQFGYQGYFSDMVKGLPEDSPLKDLGFFYSSFLVYGDYGSAFEIQPPI